MGHRTAEGPRRIQITAEAVAMDHEWSLSR